MNTKKQQTGRVGRRLNYQELLSRNQIFSILTPRRTWIENLLTLYCTCLIITQQSLNVYQVVSDDDE